MKKSDFVYIAGFFDGEGSIMIARLSPVRRKKRRLEYQLRVSLPQSGQKGKDLLGWIQCDFRGGINITNKKACKFKGYKEVWQWMVVAKLAVKYLRQIYPYLRLKKEQAELAFAFQKITSSYGNKHCFTEYERIEKYSYYETARQEMRFLNGKQQ